MNITVSRWPISFCVIGLSCALAAVLTPGPVSAWLMGFLAFVFLGLMTLSLPPATSQDASGRSDREEMSTTLGKEN